MTDTRALQVNPRIVLIILLVFATGVATHAQPAANGSDINLPFTGVYRAGAKTSVARTGQTPAAVTEYDKLPDLLATLPTDTAMRAKHAMLKPGQHNAPSQRFAEERRNVRVKDCWILAVKYEKSKTRTSPNGKTKRTGDNDFHLVIGSTPQITGGQRMNMEVAGLPPSGAPDIDTLRKVRRDFLAKCSRVPPAGRFLKFSPPIRVSIEGSLFFDGEHTADQIAPAYHLKTTWEVHPISKLQ